MSVYLDYNATTPIDPNVLDVMVDVFKNCPGNPDSRTHVFGDQAREVVETARGQVASLLGVQNSEVFFTAGATESNNIAIQGLQEYAEKTGKKHIITTSIEHKAVLNTAKHMQEIGYDVEFVSPDDSGAVSAKDVLSRVREDTLLVSVMHVNNETGIIQPVQEIGEELDRRNVLFHVDATQSCGKLVDELRRLKYDMLSFSAHKFNGPQGIGGLILRRKKYKLPPVKSVYYGGQQEHGIRPGTTPVALVAGMGAACELAEKNYREHAEKCRAIKEELYKILEKSGIDYIFNGDQSICIPSSMNICFRGVSSEALMISTKQYCALSNGSACTSKSYDPSYVLVAMGLDTDRIQSSLRISWGANTDLSVVYAEFSKVLEVAKAMVE